MRKAADFMASLGSATPIGIASGISASNVRDYLYDARVFIVASSIEDSFGVINYGRAARLADIIHGAADVAGSPRAVVSSGSCDPAAPSPDPS